jgi:hypothetical protein
MGIRNLISRINTQMWAASLPRDPDEEFREEDQEPTPVFEFVAWPKTPRLLRDVVVTEKIDGTNAAILIRKVDFGEWLDLSWQGAGADMSQVIYSDDPEPGYVWLVGAQSRNRIITLANDNQGFAKWVYRNGETLIKDLGEGRHFGEFWGQGVGRNYGLTEKRFSLFNPSTRPQMFCPPEDGGLAGGWQTPGLGVVPVLYEGPITDFPVGDLLRDLRENGSRAVPGFMKPEGLVVYHTHARRVIGKVTLDNQDAGKWELL